MSGDLHSVRPAVDVTLSPTTTVKPGLHISCKDRKHMFANMFLNFPPMPWSSHSCNDRRYLYFTRNICNRCVDVFIFYKKYLQSMCLKHDRMHVLRLYMETRLHDCIGVLIKRYLRPFCGLRAIFLWGGGGVMGCML